VTLFSTARVQRHSRRVILVSSHARPPADDVGMESIEKKHLKRMECPKCNRPKLRFGHDGGIRCDICKVDYPESDPALQKEFQRIQSEMTPPPVATGRY
jgi:hypothetical protein